MVTYRGPPAGPVSGEVVLRVVPKKVHHRRLASRQLFVEETMEREEFGGRATRGSIQPGECGDQRWMGKAGNPTDLVRCQSRVPPAQLGV